MGICRRGSHHKNGGWFARFMMRRVSKKLHLDSIQQQQLSELHGSMQDARSDVHSCRESALNDVETLLQDEKLDRNSALELMQSHQQKLEVRLRDIVGRFGELSDTLNREQRDGLLKILHRRHHCFH